ncbi:MAG: RNA polymerase sigma-70 factor (ECF subfamily) [Paraglaciecola sp.]
MSKFIDQTDKEILGLLPVNGDKAMELLFKKYYTFLCRVLIRVIPNENTAEDLAQDVLLDIWRKRDTINISVSLKAYLRRAARNKALNYIRDRKIRWEADENQPEMESTMIGANQILEAEELQQLINRSINQLPERCRLIFSLSRFEDMTYQEIADELTISIKTVENQISKALKLLRISLGKYL